jgi:transcriptional repressor of cell division inhibition gene dicB
MDKNMTKDEALEFFGGTKRLGAALNIWPHAISRWGKFPPKVRQYQIQVLSEGKLRVEDGV